MGRATKMRWTIVILLSLQNSPEWNGTDILSQNPLGLQNNDHKSLTTGCAGCFWPLASVAGDPSVHFRPICQLEHRAEAGRGSTQDPPPGRMSGGHSGFAWRIMRYLRLL